MARLKLVSHHLCPYVQRAAIALAEKSADFERVYVDLANKPGWFKTMSPLGKVPLLDVGGQVIFESAVILEYLEETIVPALHPADPLRRAEHRSWIEFGSAILNDIAGLYNAADAASFAMKRDGLAGRFARLEERLAAAPWFDGADFSLVDCVFAPVFRYFDAFDRLGITGILDTKPKLARWRASLAGRPSVMGAVTADYPDRLMAFLTARGSHISAFKKAA
jgi:glutathione S-transferase